LHAARLVCRQVPVEQLAVVQASPVQAVWQQTLPTQWRLAQSTSFEQLTPSAAGCIPLLPEPDVPPVLAPLLLAPLVLLEETPLEEAVLLAPLLPEAPPSPNPPPPSPPALASSPSPASTVEPLFEEQARKRAIAPRKSLTCFTRRRCEVTENR
jgi:hypothetical protein